MLTKKLGYVAASVLILTLPADLSAHGGTYRGPGDTVPPGTGHTRGKGGSTGGSGATTRSPTRSGATGGSGPIRPGSTGGITGANGGRGGPRTTGIFLVPDLSQWQFWWEFNKDRYLQLKDAVHALGTSTGLDDASIGRGAHYGPSRSLAPSKTDRDYIIKALKAALIDRRSNPDIRSSCMMGLAKIGGDSTILEALEGFLAANSQELSETAALAMGVSGLARAVPNLLALAQDSDEGRRLVKRALVPFRTRSFAFYGLGLIAARSKDMSMQITLFEAMKDAALGGKQLRRDIKVAALNGIRLLRPDDGEEGLKLTRNITSFLSSYLFESKEFALIRSHAITALARHIGRRGHEKGHAKEQFIKLLRNKKTKTWIHQSTVLALGQMGSAEDAEVLKVLAWYMKSGKNMQARNFCAISIGQIGGERGREFLLGSLMRKSSKKALKPWIALGLAILDHEKRSKVNYPDELDRTLADAIYTQLKGTSNRLTVAAYAIALGIMRHKDAGDYILDKAMAWKNDSEPAGYLVIALGLMKYANAKESINEVVEGAKRRPLLLSQAAIALGLLGDKKLSGKLIERLQNHRNTVAVHSALATALGFIGDRSSVAPLTAMLADERMQPLSRAFSAVALGLVGDKEILPWNSKIAANANYRANVETLTGSSTGILDIL